MVADNNASIQLVRDLIAIFSMNIIPQVRNNILHPTSNGMGAG
jgi:hypothetical protein